MFRPLYTFLLAALLIKTINIVASPLPNSTLERRAITQDLFDQLTRFTKFASAAYQLVCPIPVGSTLIEQFSSEPQDTQGYIARDDTNKQIIVAFRGSEQLQDFITDAEIQLVPFKSPGISNATTARTHAGFLASYNSVASSVLRTLSSQISSHPDYTLISTGHSLGAAIASIAGVSFKSSFPSTDVRVFTFGQPRTGDEAYARLVEDVVGGQNVFRAVHTTDGVPTIIPEALGYRHHTTEFWNFLDPATPDTVKQCTGEEDPTCSDSIPSGGINAAHLVYFGQLMALDPSVCL